MGLRTTSVSRCLEKKLLFFGYELPDVLAIFMLLAVLNLVFGQSDYKFVLVWFPTAFVAIALRIAKRGKPDNFLLHSARFQMRPKVLSAFPEPTVRLRPPSLLTKEAS